MWGAWYGGDGSGRRRLRGGSPGGAGGWAGGLRRGGEGELARRVGVSASMLSQVENDRTRPSVSTIYAIAAELGLSIDALLSGDEAAVAGLPAAAASRAGEDAGPETQP